MSHAQKNVSHVAIRSAKAGLVALLSLLGSVRATVISVTATGGSFAQFRVLQSRLSLRLVRDRVVRDRHAQINARLDSRVKRNLNEVAAR